MSPFFDFVSMNTKPKHRLLGGNLHGIYLNKKVYYNISKITINMRNNKMMNMKLQSNKDPPLLKMPKKSVIPLHIYQTWHTQDLPHHMKAHAELLKHQNPEFQYHLYDDAMCREFIQANFDEDVLWAFDKLKPGAYKADLWRYCILYKQGGIYLDIKFVCERRFRFIYLTDKEYWVRDLFHNQHPHVYQALMINLPGNPILKAAIDSIVQSCQNSVYDSVNCLSITGPGLLGKYFNQKYLQTHCELVNEGTTISCKGVPILAHYAQYRTEQHKKQVTSHYTQLWENMDIYHYPVLSPISTEPFEKNEDYKAFTLHIPDFFQEDVYKTTCGAHYQNQIWFLLSKKRTRQKTTRQKTLHFFAIFDDSMKKLLQYSECVSFANDQHTELYSIEGKEMILGTGSNANHYDMDYILQELKWYVV